MAGSRLCSSGAAVADGDGDDDLDEEEMETDGDVVAGEGEEEEDEEDEEEADNLILAIFAPTRTVSPGVAFSDAITPAAGARISTSTLSVSSDAITSSAATASPTAFLKSTNLPSLTDSATVGTRIGRSAAGDEKWRVEEEEAS